ALPRLAATARGRQGGLPGPLFRQLGGLPRDHPRFVAPAARSFLCRAPPLARAAGDRGMSQWIRVAALDEVEEEDVMRFDHGGRIYAIYRVAGQVYATDGLCTHEQALLCDGLVMGHVIECPKHNGRFDIRDGRAVRVPARIALRTYAVKVEDGEI